MKARGISASLLSVSILMSLHPMKDTLFDEKICSELPPDAGHGLRGRVQRQQVRGSLGLVMIQRPEYGGGRMWFDNVLIRKDGLFVIDELKGLNPENPK